MRLCRFFYDESELIGYYEDTRVFPIDQVVEAYLENVDDSFELPPVIDILDLLPPYGECREEARVVYEWLKTLGEEDQAGLALPIDEVELLTPINSPPKILLLAGNYAEHIKESGGMAVERAETFPYVFMKPSSTLNNQNGPVILPVVSPDHIDWECELGVVIGEVCKGVTEEEALDYVAGYTVVNDISDRKFKPNPDRKTRERDKHFDWLHGKWHDTFLPIGPCILSAEDVDPSKFHLTLKVNGETKQDCGTDKMIFPVGAIIAFISQWITLEPGDLIATGTPSGVGNASGTYLKHGDQLEAAISGIGILANPVVSETEWLAGAAMADEFDEDEQDDEEFYDDEDEERS
jgi:2-keto-4-pentenoate hydratase/2-oxohepta-3-ene-1,7-dioic acid hydratase in catechol pathway